MRQILRGEIYYADLSPVVGSEQNGHRPVLILQNDIGNRHSPTTIVAPITSKRGSRRFPMPCLKIIKTAEDGNVEGITFQIFTGKAAPSQTAVPLRTVTTGVDGTIMVEGLSAGTTYWVREVVPEGYLPQCDLRVVLLSSNTPDNPATVRFDNQLRRGSISVHKTDLSGTLLVGATFLLECSKDGGETWSSVAPASEGNRGIGTCPGVDTEGTLTTGEDGVAVFTDLVVYGVLYRLTETTAPEGYQLLAEPVFIGEIPKNHRQDYALVFDVVNSPILQMPPTGDRGQLQMIASVATALLLSVLLAAALLFRRKEETM